MEMNRFDIYRELWTKSRTAFAEEHNIEFNDLKKIIENHKIPLPDSKYLLVKYLLHEMKVNDVDFHDPSSDRWWRVSNH
ncbi:hypothetical protein [Staphylococcus haemolyticus]|uniref:hypothetical protein n=1 Tax=Staphylococcus haemolyticus TaxID=1283 RepID=UPI0015D8273D|nr:hypothetical protein [Staphylococcus haemolyticus]